MALKIVPITPATGTNDSSKQVSVTVYNAGYKVTEMTDGQLIVGQTGANAAEKTVSGDATLSADGALTIANGAVTYAKMQNVSATDKVLGRSTAGAGSPEEIDCTSTGRAVIGAASAQAGALVLKTPFTLAHSAVAASCPADASEDVLATITVPANSPSSNGMLRITTQWTFTNSANTKTLRARYSGAAGTIFQQFSVTTQATMRAQCEIHNRNATNSQVGAAIGGPSTGQWGQSTGAIVTSAVDTTASTTIVITGQKASAGETLTLEWYLVELIEP